VHRRKEEEDMVMMIIMVKDTGYTRAVGTIATGITEALTMDAARRRLR
jgi:hypothetical protein